MDFSVYVVLPCGGCGERFQASTPKQYCLADGVPLFLHTVQAFHRFPWIHTIVLTISEKRLDFAQGLLEQYGLHKVICRKGGSTRHRSIYKGVQALGEGKALKLVVCQPNDVVLIHDVVRPFVDEDILKAIAMATKETGAAGVTRPLTSTVIGVDQDGFLSQSLDRSKYKASEMPQGFLHSVISGAYGKATDYDFDYGTECLHLANKYVGAKVKIVEGKENLWKVTYRKDMYAAEGIIREGLLTVVYDEGSSESVMCLITNHLTQNHIKVIKADSQQCSDGVTNIICIYKDVPTEMMTRDQIITKIRTQASSSPGNEGCVKICNDREVKQNGQIESKNISLTTNQENTSLSKSQAVDQNTRQERGCQSTTLCRTDGMEITCAKPCQGIYSNATQELGNTLVHLTGKRNIEKTPADKDQVVDRTKRKKFQSMICLTQNLVLHVIVHKNGGLSGEEYWTMMKNFQSFVSRDKDQVYHYCILCENEIGNKGMDMISTLLKSRDKNFSGQVFFIN